MSVIQLDEKKLRVEGTTEMMKLLEEATYCKFERLLFSGNSANTVEAFDSSSDDRVDEQINLPQLLESQLMEEINLED